MTLPATMPAVGYAATGAIDRDDALVDITLPVPTPGPRDLLVEVRAISVNPVDTKVRRRAGPDAGQDYKVLGWDAVGTVRAVGAEVSLFEVGDDVFYAGSVVRPGANSRFHLVDERITGHKPASLDDAKAAALPLTAITAWEILFDRLGVAPEGGEDDAILVVGAAGGVGSILVQLAAKLTRLKVIGTASRPETADWVRELGADDVIDHGKPLSEELKRIGVDGVRYVACLTHTDQHWAEIVKSLAPQGSVALIDDPAQPIDIMLLKSKSISLHWESMFTRPVFQTPDMVEQHRLLQDVARLVDDGVLRTTFGEHYGAINAANLRRAHAFVESGKAKGKIVLEGWGG